MPEKGLTIDFYRSSELPGGVQTTFHALAQKFGLREISYFVAANARLIGHQPQQYPFFQLQGGNVLDEYQELQEKLFGIETVIKNSIVPTFHKPACTQMAVLNDNNIDGPDMLYKYGYWDYSTYSLFRRGFVELQKTTLMASRKVVAVSKHIADTYTEHFKFLKDKIVVIPNGVDTEVFKPSTDKSGLRKKYGIPEDAKVGMFVGDFHPIKGTHIVTELCRRHPEMTWILCFKFGNPATQKPPKMKNVRIFANTPHESMPELYQMADVYVQPSAVESCGLSALEAIACCVPTVVSSTGIFASAGTDKPCTFGYVPGEWTADSFDAGLKAVLREDWTTILRPKLLQEYHASKADWMGAWHKLLDSSDGQGK